MKQSLYILAILALGMRSFQAHAQSTPHSQETVYTVIYNSVPDQFRFPLIGFINIAQGSHRGLQVGFVNTTMQSFEGLQVGFVNTILENSLGAKIGFVNTTRKNSEGLRVGYVNTTLGSSKGAAFGFVNTTLDDTEGLQLGFVNIARKTLEGAQIGFVNVADSIPNGVPIGFLSFVKNGGYRALETSVNELYPFNLSFKMGVPRFYSFLQGSYYSSYDSQYAFGFGFGSLIPLKSRFYFNPELSNISPISTNNPNVTSLAAQLRYSLNSRIQLATGLSALWINYRQDSNLFDPPFFSLANYEFNAQNRLLLGARFAVSYNFTPIP